MNIGIVQGRAVRQPELRRGKVTGNVFCTFTVACDRPYKGKEAKREVDYFRVVCFSKALAQTCYNNIGQGALITVMGRLEQDKWIDQTGQRRECVQIKAQNVTIHEWLRKTGRNPSTLESDFDVDNLVPREITESLYKQVDIDDEDIPADLMGEEPVEWRVTSLDDIDI